MKGILGRKVGMTQVFSTNGHLIPVTVVNIEPNVVTQIKTMDKDGYDAIQIGAVTKTVKASNKPEMGHLKKSNSEPKRFFREIRGVDVTSYTVGEEIKADTFEAGEIVDVTATSKGKGFQGVIKRHNQSRGPMTHGSHYHRGPGSMGTMLPKRVLKGKKLPGHMGDEQVTIQNLEIVSIDLENNCILIKGNVPGGKKGLVFIKSSIKNTKSKEAIELVTYIDETVTTEVVEEVVENNEKVVDEASEKVESTKTTIPQEENSEVNK